MWPWHYNHSPIIHIPPFFHTQAYCRRWCLTHQAAPTNVINHQWSTSIKQQDEDKPHACGHGTSHSPIIHTPPFFIYNEQDKALLSMGSHHGLIWQHGWNSRRAWLHLLPSSAFLSFALIILHFGIRMWSAAQAGQILKAWAGRKLDDRPIVFATICLVAADALKLLRTFDDDGFLW